MSNHRLYKVMVSNILSLIDSGEYPIGGRLPPERELAERFDVSRPTIREAIIALEAIGRVEVKTGSGVYVKAPNPTVGHLDQISAFELTEARAMFEGEAAALAANLVTDEELKEIQTSLSDIEGESSGGTLTSEEADHRFHMLIAAASRNRAIISVIEYLWHIRDNAPQVKQAYEAVCHGDAGQRNREHQEIASALLRRDPEAARTAMHQHFSRLLNSLLEDTEARAVEAVKQQAMESRKRFSLQHLLPQ